MIDVNALLSLSELHLAGRVEKMNTDRLNEYGRSLDAFIERFSVQETKVKAALETGDYETANRCLMTIQNDLERIYADELAAECQSLMDVLKRADHDQAQADTVTLLTRVAVLSIDIQMAEYNSAKSKDNPAEAMDAPPVEKQEAAQEEAADEPTEPTVAPPPEPTVNVLAVDNAAIYLQRLDAFFQGTRFDFTGVTSGDDALRFLRDATPDLILLDIEMPHMNGYELAQKIRERGHKAPIIFITANSKRESVIKAFQAGGIDFIIKPTTKEYVLSRIGKHI